MWMIEEKTVYVVVREEDGEEVETFDDYVDAENCIDELKNEESYRWMVQNERR